VTRFLGIDYGEKRVGIAISDPFNSMALPQAFILNDSRLITSLKSLISEYRISSIVLGLPKHTHKNEETKKEIQVKIFAEQLKNETNLVVEFWDERFSTTAITKQFKAHDITRKKRKDTVDSAAAAFILQGFLDKLASALLSSSD
jgi:putative Holliday junction resolvase